MSAPVGVHVLVDCVACAAARTFDAQPTQWTPCPVCGGMELVVTVSWPGQGSTVERRDVALPEDRVDRVTPPWETRS